MRKTKLFFSALLALTLLGGCSNTPSPSTSNSSKDDNYEVINVPSGYEISSNISVSGELIDISAGEWLTVGFEYTFSFTFTNENASEPIVTSSNESVLKVTKEGSSAYKLQCLKASDAILTIKEDNEYESLHYRAVVHVHDPMNIDEAKQFLMDTSYFACSTVWWTGANYEFIFTSADSFSMNLVSDSNLIVESYSGNFEFTEEQGDEFVFTISNIQIGDGSIKLTSFRLYMNGYQLAVMDSKGLFGFFTPTNI